MNERQKTALAQRKVAAMTGFHIHATVFAVVMVGLFALNATSATANWWVQWPLLGWGLGLLGHAVAAFDLVPDFIKHRQLRQIHSERQRL